jgi:uncharacterized HAD superfamily protein
LKIDGSLVKLINEVESLAKLNDEENLTLSPLMTKYKETWTRKPCPAYTHKCAFMDCEHFTKWRAQFAQHKYYLKRKAQKAKAAKAALKLLKSQTN